MSIIDVERTIEVESTKRFMSLDVRLNDYQLQLPITDYRLPITDYRLPITDYRLPITDYNYRLPITDYRLPITDYRLPITDYQLPITDYYYYYYYHRPNLERLEGLCIHFLICCLLSVCNIFTTPSSNR